MEALVLWRGAEEEDFLVVFQFAQELETVLHLPSWIAKPLLLVAHRMPVITHCAPYACEDDVAGSESKGAMHPVQIRIDQFNRGCFTYILDNGHVLWSRQVKRRQARLSQRLEEMAVGARRTPRSQAPKHYHRFSTRLIDLLDQAFYGLQIASRFCCCHNSADEMTHGAFLLIRYY